MNETDTRAAVVWRSFAGAPDRYTTMTVEGGKGGKGGTATPGPTTPDHGRGHAHRLAVRHGPQTGSPGQE